ncbi:MAG: cytochrome c biogenesis protein CcdA, partial [Chloroflexota bacterium]|nr:cytochrome c biogenesis protein CcdA [Chloroflexota bacterium]
AFAGAWIMLGGKVNIGMFSRAAAHMGDARQVNLKSYFLFGLSYGTASLSCTLPIFIAVVGFGTTASFFSALGQFVLYGLGMGTVILVLTLGMAVFKGAMVGGLRKTLPYIQPVSAAIMLLAGAYIVFYWLTLGLDLL